MIRTKEQLIKKIREIGELKINQGIKFKELALSIEHYKQEKTLKEWFKLVQDKSFIKLEGGLEE